MKRLCLLYVFQRLCSFCIAVVPNTPVHSPGDPRSPSLGLCFMVLAEVFTIVTAHGSFIAVRHKHINPWNGKSLHRLCY